MTVLTNLKSGVICALRTYWLGDNFFGAYDSWRQWPIINKIYEICVKQVVTSPHCQTNLRDVYKLLMAVTTPDLHSDYSFLILHFPRGLRTHRYYCVALRALMYLNHLNLLNLLNHLNHLNHLNLLNLLNHKFANIFLVQFILHFIKTSRPQDLKTPRPFDFSFREF